MEGENGDKQSRKDTKERRADRMRKDKTCQKLKLSTYLENSILLENSSLSLPAMLGPGQSGEEEERVALFKAEED